MTESILIVDDSTFIVEGLVALLKKSYLPIPAFSGEECLDILRTTKPSLIILDIMMEPLDGWETLARIKSDPATRHIPVLMFSAKKISPEEAEAHRIIIDDFITKPVQPRTLIGAIEKVLARQEFNRQILSRWESAGVSPEVIDEYLMIKMNLDVDVSLLAVMNRQLEFSFGGGVNREDIERSILTLESRIGSARSRIEAFCRDRAGIIPVPGDEPGGGRDTIPPVPLKDAPPEPETPVVTVVPVDTADALPVLPGDDTPPSDESGTPAVRLENPSPRPETPQGREESPVAPVAPAVLFTMPVSMPEEGDFDVVAVQPGPAVYPREDKVTRPVPEIRPGQHEIRQDTSITVPEPSPLFEPYLPATTPAGGTPAELRRTVPHDPDAMQSHSRPAASGGGTATPRMRSFASTSRLERQEQEEHRDSSCTGPAPVRPGGLLSRLVATVLAFFGRKKP